MPLSSLEVEASGSDVNWTATGERPCNLSFWISIFFWSCQSLQLWYYSPATPLLVWLCNKRNFPQRQGIKRWISLPIVTNWKRLEGWALRQRTHHLIVCLMVSHVLARNDFVLDDMLFNRFKQIAEGTPVPCSNPTKDINECASSSLKRKIVCYERQLQDKRPEET